MVTCGRDVNWEDKSGNVNELDEAPNGIMSKKRKKLNQQRK